MTYYQLISSATSAEAKFEQRQRLKQKLMHSQQQVAPSAEAKFEERLKQKLMHSQQQVAPTDTVESKHKTKYQMSFCSYDMDCSNIKFIGTLTTSEPTKELREALKAHYLQIWAVVLQDGSMCRRGSSSSDFQSSSLARHAANHCSRFSSKKKVIEWCMKNIRVKIQKKESVHENNRENKDCSNLDREPFIRGTESNRRPKFLSKSTNCVSMSSCPPQGTESKSTTSYEVHRENVYSRRKLLDEKLQRLRSSLGMSTVNLSASIISFDEPLDSFSEKIDKKNQSRRRRSRSIDTDSTDASSTCCVYYPDGNEVSSTCCVYYPDIRSEQ